MNNLRLIMKKKQYFIPQTEVVCVNGDTLMARGELLSGSTADGLIPGGGMPSMGSVRRIGPIPTLRSGVGSLKSGPGSLSTIGHLH